MFVETERMHAAALLALAAGLTLPEPQLDIARRIAASGRPHCTSYSPDGAIGPCLPSFAVKSGDNVNAHAVGPRIEFTIGATERLTPDEFALLAGHEVAHYFLGHNASNRANEIAADRLGAELACQAGYDPFAGSSLFRFLRPGKAHPRRELRRAAVAAVRC